MIYLCILCSNQIEIMAKEIHGRGTDKIIKSYGEIETKENNIEIIVSQFYSSQIQWTKLTC